MADTANPELEAPPKKASKLPLILGLVLAIGGGAGGFYAVKTGLILGESASEHAEDSADQGEETSGDAVPEVAFVPVAPITVSLGHGSDSRYLRFSASLEVPIEARSDVEHMMPRIIDALNSFLQAVEERDVANRDALLRLRVQMLHRVRLVVGTDRVRDLLISEFVLN
ncbi:MAG: flagellar basal body-associated FliL family protein [Roseivivax sp.]|nr:flagellar basal body-associated FliL family protein [Roseivivax sp.]